eukprot:1138924-Rhodomonas_salina.4
MPDMRRGFAGPRERRGEKGNAVESQQALRVWRYLNVSHRSAQIETWSRPELAVDQTVRSKRDQALLPRKQARPRGTG